jgi:sugar phosphate isomerase/epimerase
MGAVAALSRGAGVTPLRFSLSTACLAPLALPCVAEQAAATGFDGLELVVGVGQLLRWSRRVAQTASKLPLPVLTVHQPLYQVGRWARPAVLMRDTLELALSVQAEAVVLHSPWALSWQDAAARDWLKALEQIAAQVAGSGVRLTVENLGEHPGLPGRTVLGRLDDLAAFCRGSGLSLTYDTCHAGTLNADLAGELVSVRDLLANVHLSDYRAGSHFRHTPLIDLMFANHQMPGEGGLNLHAALAALVQIGYAGPVTFEVSPYVLRSWRPARRRQRLAEALQYARDAVSEIRSQQQPEPMSTIISAE